MSTKEIPFGKIKENKVYLSAWGSYPEREIGEIRESEEESIQYFLDRFTDLESKVEALQQDIESSQNKGSFLMKLLHMKEVLPEHIGLGDYRALHDKLNLMESMLTDIIEKNREKNTEIKRALLEEMRVAVEKINWKESTLEIHDIKARWIKTGNAKEDVHEELESEFWELINNFFEKKKQFYEDKKLLGEKRKKEYETLVDEATKVESMFGKDRFDKINYLKEAWKNVGNIPKEEYSPLLMEFNRRLKARPRPVQHTFSLDEALATLQSYYSGDRYNFKVLSDIKTQLKNFKATDYSSRGKRHEAFGLIQLLTEKDFLDKLAMKRFRNFRELERAKKKTIRIGILEELISRDKADLDKFQNNSANFNSGNTGMHDLVMKKLAQQQGKIEIKEKLLASLKSQD